MLGDCSDGLIVFEPGSAMEDLMVAWGKFSSKGQARKNGWGGPIPDGFTELRIGKVAFWIWNKRAITPEETAEFDRLDLIETGQ